MKNLFTLTLILITFLSYSQTNICGVWYITSDMKNGIEMPTKHYELNMEVAERTIEITETEMNVTHIYKKIDVSKKYGDYTEYSKYSYTLKEGNIFSITNDNDGSKPRKIYEYDVNYNISTGNDSLFLYVEYKENIYFTLLTKSIDDKTSFLHSIVKKINFYF